MALFQDAAYIILTDDNHWLLNEEPFNTKEFRDYVEICKKHIEEKNNRKQTNGSEETEVCKIN